MVAPVTYRQDRPLTTGEIAQYAPSILAEAPHESRGHRYAFIRTMDVLQGLQREGFEPFSVSQTRVKDESRREHTKHLLRLRHPDAMAAATVGTEIPEIVLVNSHDGTSSYQLMAGIYRLVCSNGMIVGHDFGEVKVRHTGNVVDDVIEGSFRVIDDMKEVTARVEDYKAITLNEGEQNAFAKAAIALRWEEDKAPVAPEQIIRPTRWQDRQDDLWHVFNRAQEHLVKGGVRGRTTTGRRMSTRAVTGVNEDVRLNRSLWTLADELAKIKQS